jgi:hypothetical protein
MVALAESVKRDADGYSNLEQLLINGRWRTGPSQRVNRDLNRTGKQD